MKLFLIIGVFFLNLHLFIYIKYNKGSIYLLRINNNVKVV